MFYYVLFELQDIIRLPPRDVRQPLINKTFVTDILISAAIIISGTLSVFYKEVDFLELLIFSNFHCPISQSQLLIYITTVTYHFLYEYQGY